MNKKTPTKKKEILDYLYSLPIEEFSKIVKDYDMQHQTKFSRQLEELYASDTFCYSAKIVKRERTANFQRYRCEECNHSFTSVTNTFLNKSKFSCKVWGKILEMTIHIT